MTPLNSMGQKIGGWCKQCAILWVPSYSQFLSQNSLPHGNKGRQGRNSNDTIR